MGLFNRRGLSVIEILVALGIGAVVIGSTVTVMGVISKRTSETQNWDWLYDLRFAINSSVMNDKAFQYTVADPANSSMQCLVNHTDCQNLRGVHSEIRLRDIGNNVIDHIAYPGVATQGVQNNGLNCQTFGSSPTCALRYSITWTPLCDRPTGACLNPQVQVKGQLQVSSLASSTASKIRPVVFNLLMNRLESAATPSQICGMMGGSMNGSNCQVMPTAQCPVGQYLKGYNSVNQPICVSMAQTTCPSGGILQSINADGTFTCISGCSGNGAGGGSLVFQ